MALEYYEYLKSSEWQKIRKLALERAKHKCQICGRVENLDVHHNSYEHIGKEREYLEDLVVLCSEHHQIYHDTLAETEKLTDPRLEERLLGALLQQTPAFIQTLFDLPLDVFTSSLRQEVFKYLCSRAIEELAADSAIVASYLNNRKILEAEEAESLLNVWVNRCSVPQNAEAYARELRELHLRRRIQQLPARITRLNRDQQQSIPEMIDLIQGEIQSILSRSSANRLTTAAEILSTAFSDIEYKSLGMILPGLSCGFYDLDAMTQGFQRSDLIIVAGRPSIGKTAFCLNVARNVAAFHKLPVCIFSLEMSKEQLTNRLIGSEVRIESGRLRAGRIGQKEWEPLGHATSTLSQLPLFIDDRSNITVSDIRSKARQVMLEQGGTLGLIVVDYLQLLVGSNDDDRAQELAKITRSLKGLAKELNVPVIALSQLSRSVESRTNKRPMMSDLRESGSIEQDADVIMMIYRDEYYNPDTVDRGMAEVIVSKHRNGPTGTIKLIFESQFTQFRNLAAPSRI